MPMDDFTTRHLLQWCHLNCYHDERDAFIEWMNQLEEDELEYYIDSAGWPPALSAFRKQQQQREA
jgi:hypothetical protein